MSGARVAPLAAALLALAAAADAGHEIPYYPSFYPQQITVRVIGPAPAARELERGALHAWVGADPFEAAPPPQVASVDSLAGFVVLTFAPGSAAAADGAARCATAEALGRALPETAGFVRHPYPITPYHEDYLAHADRAAARREGPAVAPAAPGALRIRATGRMARLLEAAGERPAGGEADAALEEIPLDRLVGDERSDFAGRPAPPWIKDGVEQAYRLLAGAAGDEVRPRAEALHRSLHEASLGLGQRLDLGRRLVALLTAGCRRAVLGYTIRREPINVDYSTGIENVAWDSQHGLASAVFVRTAKLKDFPWNGWLEVGVPAAPASAWNPVAGFTDPAGRLVWAALADPALIPAPRGDGWVDNRVRVLDTEVATGPTVEVPAGTLVPDPRRGLRPSDRPATARARIVYQVLGSKFHDGSALTVADLLYPYALAFRWGAGPGPRFDADLARSTAPLRRALAGVRPVRSSTEVKEFGDVQVLTSVLVVEVYLGQGDDPRWLPAVAPPWSPVPWTVLALGEEAVARGLAAFSAGAAGGRPWLDLARDRALGRRLDALAAEFERQGWVPEALRGIVRPPEARQRWAALRRHYRQAGHFLVTNGPYRLARWEAGRVVLDAFRDLSYPLVVGAFDRWAYPRRGFVTEIERRGERLALRAEVETVVKEGRSVRLERVPLRMAGGRPTAAVVARWVTLDATGTVVAAGASDRLEGERLIVEPGAGLAPGRYQVLVALAVDGNAVNPEVQQVAYPVPG
jgi:hypothetical protein